MTRILTPVLMFLAGMGLSSGAMAHPHVFVEASLEIVRGSDGKFSELRQVWRFDELFSTTVVLDFDANANNLLEPEELEEVSKTVTKSVGEENFFTEIRLGKETIDFVAPDRINVDYKDGQILMFFEAALARPVAPTEGDFRISVSDPTYYVAMEIAEEGAVVVSGNAAGCTSQISRPDYDLLLSQSQAQSTEDFFNNPSGTGLGDDWLTWVTLKCS